MNEVSRRHQERLQFYVSYVTPVVLAAVGMCGVIAYIGFDARLFNTLAAAALIIAAAWIAVEAARRYFEQIMGDVEARVRERLAEELRAVSAQLQELDSGVGELRCEVEALGGQMLVNARLPRNVLDLFDGNGIVPFSISKANTDIPRWR